VSATEFGRQLQRYVVKKAPRMSEPGAVVRRLGGARRLQAAGDLESAEEVLREVAVVAPDLAEVWDALEYLKTQQGDFQGALEVRKERIATGISDTERVEADSGLMARVKEEGARAYWSWRLEEMKLRAAEGKRVSPVEMARACVGLDDYEGAISYLQEGLKAKDRNIISLWGDPAWDPLRTDPRFRSILSELRHAGARPGHFIPNWP
jgi:tetratricopeptide (TPR) repeat protein